MVWGWGEHGQLGLGTVEDRFYPELVAIPPIAVEGELRWRTFCGTGFSIAIAEQYVQI
jgi:alpha-tubulin suppressor-like RCC1 family protein